MTPRRILMVVGLLMGAAFVGGCFSFGDYTKNIRQLNHYLDNIEDIRVLTNKHLMEYDEESPFED